MEQASTEQRKRREMVRQAHRSACRALFARDGTRVHDSGWDKRALLWHASSFLEGGGEDRALGVALVAGSLKYGGGHFWMSAAASVLARFSDRIDGPTLDAVRSRFVDSLGGESLQRFRGYNDNYPAMAAVSLIVGGEATGHRRYRDDGFRCLESGLKLLRRRGALSEFCSPTYTAITLTCLAEIVELSCDVELKQMALEMEQCVWMEVAARFHQGSSFFAGPFSRAYTVDLCGHHHNLHSSFFQAFGEVSFVNPMTALFPATGDGQVCHGPGIDSMQAHCMWQTLPMFHPSPEAHALVAEALGDAGVRTILATVEQAAFPRGFWRRGDGGDRTPTASFAAGVIHTESHLRSAYCHGTSDAVFLDGYQYAPYVLSTRRDASERAPSSVQTLFTRYLLDGKMPSAGAHIQDEGRACGVSTSGAALVAYTAKPQWGDPSPVPDWENTPCRRLGLSVVVPFLTTRPCAIFAGEKRVSDWQGVFTSAEPVFIDLGSAFVSLNGLATTDYGRAAELKIELCDGFGLVSWINYEGPPRTFTDQELFRTLSVVAVEVAARTDVPSFEVFRRTYAEVCLTDQFCPGDDLRTSRLLTPRTELLLQTSPLTGGVKCRLIDDRLAPESGWSVLRHGSSGRTQVRPDV